MIFFCIWHFLYCIVVEPFLNWGGVYWIVARFGGAEAKRMSGSLRKPASLAAWGPLMIISIRMQLCLAPTSTVFWWETRKRSWKGQHLEASLGAIHWDKRVLSKPLVFWCLTMTPQESLLGATLVLSSCRQYGVYISVTSPCGIRKNTEALPAK